MFCYFFLESMYFDHGLQRTALFIFQVISFHGIVSRPLIQFSPQGIGQFARVIFNPRVLFSVWKFQMCRDVDIVLLKSSKRNSYFVKKT